MSRQGEPGRPGEPGHPGTPVAGGTGGTGGEGGRGGTALTRTTLYAVVFLFLFSVLLAGANVLFTARQVNSVRVVTAAAGRNAASVHQLCLSGNEFRAEQITLWDHILTISPPPPHETPAQQRARTAAQRAFEAYIHHVFAPRDCSKPLGLSH